MADDSNKKPPGYIGGTDPRQMLPDDELTRKHLDRSRFPDKFAGLNRATLVDPSGEPIPRHLTAVKLGERVSIAGCNFFVAFVGKGCVLLEPIEPLPEPPAFPPIPSPGGSGAPG